MNYRHVFHAGNFADVHKHALLARLAQSFTRKDKPFRVYDTHAGTGLYDLSSAEAARTGEHRQGIGRLLASPVAGAPLLADYTRIVGQVAQERGPDAYPGSPLLLRRLLRRQDRLSAYELHPADYRALAGLFAGDTQVKAIELDGWLALGAHLPPKERRGLVLIDPPFEEAGEFERIVSQLARAVKRWRQGTYAIWHPLKRPADRKAFHAALVASRIPDIIACEFYRQAFTADDRLVGSGLVVVNPPYGFASEAESIMNLLLPVLAVERDAHCGINVLAAEDA